MLADHLRAGKYCWSPHWPSPLPQHSHTQTQLSLWKKLCSFFFFSCYINIVIIWKPFLDKESTLSVPQKHISVENRRKRVKQKSFMLLMIHWCAQPDTDCRTVLLRCACCIWLIRCLFRRQQTATFSVTESSAVPYEYRCTHRAWHRAPLCRQVASNEWMQCLSWIIYAFILY